MLQTLGERMYKDEIKELAETYIDEAIENRGIGFESSTRDELLRWWHALAVSAYIHAYLQGKRIGYIEGSNKDSAPPQEEEEPLPF